MRLSHSIQAVLKSLYKRKFGCGTYILIHPIYTLFGHQSGAENVDRSCLFTSGMVYLWCKELVLAGVKTEAPSLPAEEVIRLSLRPPLGDLVIGPLAGREKG
jgi:hypothetical protein